MGRGLNTCEVGWIWPVKALGSQSEDSSFHSVGCPGPPLPVLYARLSLDAQRGSPDQTHVHSGPPIHTNPQATAELRPLSQFPKDPAALVICKHGYHTRPLMKVKAV